MYVVKNNLETAAYSQERPFTTTSQQFAVLLNSDENSRAIPALKRVFAQLAESLINRCSGVSSEKK